MSDLISRQSAIEEIEFGITNMKAINIETGEVIEPFAKINDELREAVNRVKALPSAQRTGKWIIRDNPGTGWYRVTCSECGEDVTSTAPCIGFFPNAKVTWNYCPECGARMDAERKEE